MNKNLLLLLGAGALAFVLYKNMGKGDTDDSAQITDEAKLSDCQAQLNEALKTVRTANLEQYKADFIDRCMA
jgi:hypothetical protein